MEVTSMDPVAVKSLAAALAIALGGISPAVAVGLIGKAGMDAMGRNPEAASKVQTGMIMSIAFAEGIAIFALLVALIIKFV